MSKERIEFKDIEIRTVAESEHVDIINARVTVTVGQRVDKSYYRYGGRATEEIVRDLRLRVARRIYGDFREKIHELEEVVRYRCIIPDSETWEKLREAFTELRNYGDDIAEKPEPEPATA